MEPGGGALLKRSIICDCDSPRAPCILVRGRERRKKKEVRIDRNGGPVGEEKKGKVCKADCELARVAGIGPVPPDACFHRVDDGGSSMHTKSISSYLFPFRIRSGPVR